MQLSGRIALVTGANRGVGAALVDALMERAARKVYAGARDVSSLDGAVSQHGSRLVPIQLDVTKRSDIDAAADMCSDVEVLVSNAGLAPAGPVLETSDALMREVFDVNVFGPMALVRAFAPALTRNRGGLLFINSVTGLSSRAARRCTGQARPQPGCSYSACESTCAGRGSWSRRHIPDSSTPTWLPTCPTQRRHPDRSLMRHSMG